MRLLNLIIKFYNIHYTTGATEDGGGGYEHAGSEFVPDPLCMAKYWA
jgi:hypothetical protein